jgi:hypothetical protein
LRQACLASALALAIDGTAWPQQAPQPAGSDQAQPAPGTAGQPGAPPGQVEQREPSREERGVRGNDFPTLARVEYVLECIGETPGPRHEVLYKCVCAVDRVAEAVPYDRWVDLSTFFKAQPMAGERGAYVRERADIQSQLKSYRELQARVRKACFIPEKK